MRALSALLSFWPVLVVACGATPAPPPPHELPPVTTRPEVAVVPAVPSVVDAGTAAPDVARPTPVSFDALVLTAAASRNFAGAAGNIAGDSGLSGVFTVGDSVFAAGTGFVLRSTDRGLHFARTEVAPRFPVVWSPSEGEVFVAGEGGVVRSTDGGVSFAPTGAAPGSAVTGIWGPSAEQIYIAGAGGSGGPFVARSTDHGATWVRLPIPALKGWLHDVGTTDGHDVLAAGTEDTARVTSSGIPEKNALVLRSTDGGAHWKRLPMFAKGGTDYEETRRICFAEGTLFASSAYGLHVTRDLGKTWRVATQVGAEVLALACRGKQVVVGGRNRSLFVSIDGGATWQRDPLGSLFADPSLVSVQAAAISETGEMYVGFEGLYTDHRGSLFRRSP